MVQVRVIVEGQTEEQFVKNVVRDDLATRGVWLEPVNLKGIPKYQTLGQRILREHVRGGGPFVITTMLDLYRLPADWPGKDRVAGLRPEEKARHIQQCLLQDIAGDDAHLRQRFIPFIQLHEFEAVLFADIAAICSVMDCSAADRRALEEILFEFDGKPERINDRPDLSPSCRLRRLFGSRYRKELHGNQISSRMGLETILSQCDHFRGWHERLIALAASAQQ